MGDACSTQGRDSTRLHAPARRVLHAVVTADVVDVRALEELVADRSAGAVVTFGGIVRDHDGGRSVTMIRRSHLTEAMPYQPGTIARTG